MANVDIREELSALGKRLAADFGAVCTLEAMCPMLDIRLRGELFVIDYDNGPAWQPRKLFRVAHVTGDYAFNMSNDPAFPTVALAEQYLRSRLASHASINPNT